MNTEDYKRKLNEFNSTERYKSELEFLFKIISPSIKEKILDIGCGTGYAVRKIRERYLCDAFGYDKNNYREDDDEFLFRSQYYFHFDKAYFMHSFAHINNPVHFLNYTMPQILYTGAHIYIITPNAEYLNENKKQGYIPDPTVVRHYELSELCNTVMEAGYKVVQAGQFGEYKNGINERLFLIAKWGR